MASIKVNFGPTTIDDWIAYTDQWAGSALGDPIAATPNTSGISNPPPAAVLQSVRSHGGESSFSQGGFAPNASVHLRIFRFLSVQTWQMRLTDAVSANTVNQVYTGDGTTVGVMELDCTANSSGVVQINITNVANDFGNTIINAAEYTEAPPAPDTTDPTGSVHAPTEGQPISGIFPFKISATDNVAVASVQLKIDNVNVGAPITSPTGGYYERSVDTASLGNGSHPVKAVITDTAGRTYTTPVVNFTVNNSEVIIPDVIVTLDNPTPVTTSRNDTAWDISGSAVLVDENDDVLIDDDGNALTEPVVPQGYQIRRATNQAMTQNVMVINRNTPAPRTYSDTSAVAGTLYWYQVRARISDNEFSAWSTAKSVTTLSPPPEPENIKLFPLAISSFAARPMYSTVITEGKSGREVRDAIWDDARRKYDAKSAVKNFDHARKLLKFFHTCKGRWKAFLVKDFTDFSYDYTACELSGNGARTAFQMREAYTDDFGDTEYRDIKRPKLGTVQVKVNGVLKTEEADYTVNYETGIITFLAAPANAAVITQRCEFYVRCRFDTDELPSVEFFEYWIGLSGEERGLSNVETVPLIEVRE